VPSKTQSEETTNMATNEAIAMEESICIVLV
jgi:hypothetical protein